MHGVERLGDGLAGGEQAVVAQDHGVVVAEVPDQLLAILGVDHHALVVVIADPGEAHRGLGVGQQAAFHRRHRHAGPGVGVDDAVHVGLGHVDRAVDHEAGAVDAVVEARPELGLGQHVAVVVDLDQARGGDLLVEHAVGVDQEMVGLARHAHRDVVGDQVGHAVDVHQPVAGGEIDAGLPFLGRDLRFEVGDLGRLQRMHAHGNAPGLVGFRSVSKLPSPVIPGLES